MQRASSYTHPPFCSSFQATDLSSKAQAPLPREKLKVPPRPFPLEEHSHYKHSGQLQVFFTQLEPNSHGVRQSSHVSVETNSNKRISVLGTNHTKIYRVNLVGFKHSAEDPSRSPHHQNKYTLRSKRFSNVLSNHQGRFPETVPEAKHSQTEAPITESSCILKVHKIFLSATQHGAVIHASLFDCKLVLRTRPPWQPLVAKRPRCRRRQDCQANQLFNSM